jgi:hypothetical protein
MEDLPMRWNLIQKSVLLIPIIISMSCNTSELIIPIPKYAPPNDVRKIISLHVGMQWTFQAVSWGELGLSETTIVVRTVVDSEIHEGKTWYLVNDDPITASPGDPSTIWVIDSSSYVRWLYVSVGPLNPRSTSWWFSGPALVLETPLTRGHAWKVWQDTTQADPGSWYGRMTLTSIDTAVIVHGKVFEHCIAIDPCYDDNQSYWWHLIIAPHIGVIAEYFSLGGLGGIGMELISKNF